MIGRPPKLAPDPTDLRILQELANGGSVQRIAPILGYAPGTLKHRVKRICDLLGADTRTQAVAMALRRGLIE